VILALLVACAPRHEVVTIDLVEIRSRSGDALPALGASAQVDRGLRDAAERLAAAATSAEARLTEGAVRTALDLAGYPGAARFVKVIAGTELPAGLLDNVPRGEPIDVGWAWRDFGDGRRWWVLGWAPRRVTLDPVPRDLVPGGGVGVRVTGAPSARMFVASPRGVVTEYDLAQGTTRWVGGLDEPGDWRFEVVDHDRVELAWTHYVGASPPALTALPVERGVESPMDVPPRLYDAVDALRVANGLAALERFSDFEPLVREQAACIAAGGEALHRSDLCPGVAARAAQGWYPRGAFHEDVAVASGAAEAWAGLRASPGHLANLLCRDCTHISIGAALEPAADPRLFIVFELMRFSEGEPEPIRRR